MSEHVSQSNRPLNWLFPVIFLAIVAICSLYIVRNNYNETPPSSDYSTKDTRSDHRETMIGEVPIDSSGNKSTDSTSNNIINSTNTNNSPNSTNTSRGDSTKRERESQPQQDSTRK